MTFANEAYAGMRKRTDELASVAVTVDAVAAASLALAVQPINRAIGQQRPKQRVEEHTKQQTNNRTLHAEI